MSVRRLRGAEADLNLALDHLYFAGTVHGVVEREGEREVRFTGRWPDLPGVVVSDVTEPDAEVTGLEDDAPILVTEQLLVRPPWVAPVPGFRGIELVVPRAMAFGSGEHGSTRAALQALERVYVEGVQSAADVGTGSGILALYLMRRGCPRVLACDIDPVAVRAAADLLPEAEVFVGTASDLGTRCDVVVANLRASELRPCLDDLFDCWTGRGPLVLSGIRSAELRAFRTELPLDPELDIEVAGFHALGFSPRA